MIPRLMKKVDMMYEKKYLSVIYDRVCQRFLYLVVMLSIKVNIYLDFGIISCFYSWLLLDIDVIISALTFILYNLALRPRGI